MEKNDLGYFNWFREKPNLNLFLSLKLKTYKLKIDLIVITFFYRKKFRRTQNNETD